MVPRIACLCLVLGVVGAATFQGKAPAKPVELAHKEGCYVKEIKDVIPFGATVKPIGHCYMVECGKGMLYYASCGTVLTDDPKCHKTATDLRKPYPDCCPTIKCESENRV